MIVPIHLVIHLLPVIGIVQQYFRKMTNVLVRYAPIIHYRIHSMLVHRGKDGKEIINHPGVTLWL